MLKKNLYNLKEILFAKSFWPSWTFAITLLVLIRYLFRMEVVGRCPSIDEEVEFSVQGDVPVWLPTKPTIPQFSQDIRAGLTFLRKANIFINCPEICLY